MNGLIDRTEGSKHTKQQKFPLCSFFIAVLPLAILFSSIIFLSLYSASSSARPASGGRSDRVLALAALAPAASNANRSYVAELIATAKAAAADKFTASSGSSSVEVGAAGDAPSSTSPSDNEVKQEEDYEDEDEDEAAAAALLDAVVFFEEEKVATAEAWGRHARFAFEVSPQGNGVDSHRTWEALLLGTIPIVRRSFVTDRLHQFDSDPQTTPPMYTAAAAAAAAATATAAAASVHQPNSIDALYKGLPVVVVDDWAEAANRTNLRRWHRELGPLFENSQNRNTEDAGSTSAGTSTNNNHYYSEELRARLSVDHWIGLVREKQRERAKERLESLLAIDVAHKVEHLERAAGESAVGSGQGEECVPHR